MRKIVIPIFLVVLVIFFLFVFFKKADDKIEEPVYQKPRNGVAVIITGAAARIPQEAALLEELDNRGMLKDLVFISGVSSGALNSVMLNGIISKKISWEDYKNILFSIKTSDIFVQEGKRIPVNTEPAREFYKRVVEGKLGYYTIGDLPVTTGISITPLKDILLKKTVYRICSRKINNETDTTLSLVDVLMASTAFPVVFPTVKIGNVKTIPDLEYIDGGVGEDYVPYHALLQFEKYRGCGVEKVYIISRKSDTIPDVSEELKSLGINDKGIFDRLGISLDAILKKEIKKRLKAYAADAPELVPLTYIWIPDFETNFLLFNFDKLKEQYELTKEWAKTSEPILLSDYLNAEK